MSLTPKYIRAHRVTPAVAGDEGLAWMFKLLYEFWGFCINGGTDLSTSLGFASSGINMPAGFESGSLLMSGTAGYTVAGESIFRDDSQDFLTGAVPPLKDKFIVTWKSGSTSNDDSVYRIIQVIDSGSVRVDTSEGATPYSASLRPLFTDRSSINYRIVDLHETATTLSFASGNYLVMDLSDAPTVNEGQLASQVKVALKSTTQVAVSVSPSGSWDGSAFTDETAETSPTNWVSTGGSGEGRITMIGANDFIIVHLRGQETSWNGGADGPGSGLHVEIPYRIYPREFDPNPVAFMVWARDVMDVNTTTDAYGGGWKMHYPPTNETLGFETLIRNPHGDYWDGDIYSGNVAQNALPGRYSMAWYNPISDKQFISDVILGKDSTGAFHMGRVRMRRWRYSPRQIPNYTRLGTNGEWLHVTVCISWPWDNAILPRNLLALGA